jgi:hypothetical protein
VGRLATVEKASVCHPLSRVSVPHSRQRCLVPSQIRDVDMSWMCDVSHSRSLRPIHIAIINVCGMRLSYLGTTLATGPRW